MKLKTILSKKSGRNSSGKLTVRHQGGRQKRYLREIDFKRGKKDLWGTVENIEVDPNRSAKIAKIIYEDGERRYILAPDNLHENGKIIASVNAPLDVGCTIPLSHIPVGTPVHNIEIVPGKGGQMVRSAGSVAIVHGKENKYVLIKFPSGEIKRFNPLSMATIGQVGNIAFRTKRLHKAGTKRKMGIKPSVRGTAQNPRSHPHGGGEGRSGVGLKYQKTPWGKPAVGKTRKRGKYSDSLIIERRKKGKHG